MRKRDPINPSFYQGLRYSCVRCHREVPSHDSLDKEGHCEDCHRPTPLPGHGDMAAREGPWASTPLPIPDIMFKCPGGGWHNVPWLWPDEMRWMQGVGTDISDDWPEDDFYCYNCILYAKAAAAKVGLPPEVIVTGPTLAETLKLRGLPNLADSDWGQSLLYP